MSREVENLVRAAEVTVGDVLRHRVINKRVRDELEDVQRALEMALEKMKEAEGDE